MHINEYAGTFMSVYIQGNARNSKLKERFVLRKTSARNYIAITLLKEQLYYLHFVRHFIAATTMLKTSC